MKEIKDYLHLYLGCECKERIKHNEEYRNPKGGTLVFTAEMLLNYLSGYRIYDIFLRPFSDMTEEEGIGYAQIFCANKIPVDCEIKIKSHESGCLHVTLKSGGSELSLFPGSRHDKPEAFRYLLSKHFDLFSLIENGLAIDAATLKTEK